MSFLPTMATDDVTRLPTSVSGPRTVPASPRAVRRDIEGLRALAVGLVVAYHLWPGRLSGGFVGVDVFLVLSGFLITSHLLAHPPRTPRDLVEFWGRRVRRLLPASFLVLAVTLVVTWRFAPATQWAETAHHVLASTLYVENWALASRAVDYLAADAAPTPVQHFWSLGVEEQFYLIWPVVVLALAAVSRSVARSSGVPRTRAWITSGLAVIVMGSFAASLHVTATDQARAYFVTHVRIWELGAGALLAGLLPTAARALAGRPAARAVLAWTGLAVIVVAAITIDGTVPFPGAAALMPVLGTVAVIAADAQNRVSPYRILALRPVQYVGSISYSIYLWHWPLIVLFPYVLGRSRGLVDSLLIGAASIILAAATKVGVEDRLRGTRPLGVPLWRTYAFMAGIMIVLMLLVAAVRADLTHIERQSANRLVVASQEDPCYGGNALVTEGCEPHGAELLIEPAAAARDKPDPYTDDCWVLGDFTNHKVCAYGSTAADARDVALVGNSHAGHWLPALQELAEQENLRIHTYLISECYTVNEEIEFGNADRNAACLAWNDRVFAETTDGRYEAIVVSNRFGRPLAGVPSAEQADAARAAHRGALDRWTASGVPVVVIRDTPYAELKNVPDCVAEHAGDLGQCDGGRDREQFDPLAETSAQYRDPLVQVVDLTDRICRDDTCYSVVGGVIVYFDAGHLSATFARSLAPALREPVAAALRR